MYFVSVLLLFFDRTYFTFEALFELRLFNKRYQLRGYFWQEISLYVVLPKT